MCLDIKSGPHIAKKDFYTFKTVIGLSKNYCYSSVRGAKLMFKKELKTVMDVQTKFIYRGFHSIIIRRHQDTYTGHAIALVKIPKGTEYYIGKNNDLVSNRIVIEEIYYHLLSDSDLVVNGEYSEYLSSVNAFLKCVKIAKSYGLNIKPS